MSTPFIQLCGNTREACLWLTSTQLHAKCTLEICVMNVRSFSLLIWAVASFLLPNIRRDVFDILFILYLQLHFSSSFPWVYEQLHSAFFLCFGPIPLHCFMVLVLELPQYSPLALDHETNEKSKMTASKRKWFMLWRETWKDTPLRTLGALFSLQATAGLAHFKITSQFI